VKWRRTQSEVERDLREKLFASQQRLAAAHAENQQLKQLVVKDKTVYTKLLNYLEALSRGEREHTS
jgi:phage terminase Nu1 subunit (DNA packaging protein)